MAHFVLLAPHLDARIRAAGTSFHERVRIDHPECIDCHKKGFQAWLCHAWDSYNMKVVSFLASDEASYVSSVELIVGGGVAQI